MANTALLVASALLVFAYLLDLACRRFRLPAVVMLVVSGIVLQLAARHTTFEVRWVGDVVPIIGTLGLILIVLEGALDLEVSRDRAPTVARAFASGALGVALTAAALAWLFQSILGLSPYVALVAAAPFAVISSAIAIPSAAHLSAPNREFVIYESALSDIIGVLVFYALASSKGSVEDFAIELFGIGFVSAAIGFAVALGLFVLVNRVEGHVRFFPLLAGLVLLYALGKAAHLSPLVFVLVAGLLLNNPHLLEWNERLHGLRENDYMDRLAELKGVVAELVFAVKAFFFIFLGFWTDLSTLLVPGAWLLAAAAMAIIYALRAGTLWAVRVRDPGVHLWMAPRGLITVLLFLTAQEVVDLKSFPMGTLMITVLCTATLVTLADRAQRRLAVPGGAL